MPTLAVREFDLLVRGEAGPARPGVRSVPEDAFDALWAFVAAPVAGHRGQSEVIARPTLHGSRPALRLQQWVGVIRTPDGTTLEILPKIHEHELQGDGSEEALVRSRALLLRMLAAAGTNYRSALPADLDPARMPLVEVVLRSALDVLQAAVRRGVPHAYHEVQEERAGLRGRLEMSRQLRQPPHRAHLLQVTYDDFLPNRPETRLTRLTVERVARLTRRDDTKRLARELLFALEGVPPSRDVRRDFQGWTLERGSRHFAAAQNICRMILNELNPLTAGRGARVTALLFDMNRVYEGYVAALLRRQHPEWTVETQVRGEFLGQVASGAAPGRGLFALRPDLRVQCDGQALIIADTKWKRLTPGAPFPHGVLNADAYQMLAYSSVFQRGPGPKLLCLIYPRLPGVPAALPDITLPGGERLRIVTVDLYEQTPRVELGALGEAERA